MLRTFGPRHKFAKLWLRVESLRYLQNNLPIDFVRCKEAIKKRNRVGGNMISEITN